MKQEKKRTTLYLLPAADAWVTKQARQQGVSKNDIIQALISRAMGKGT